MRIATVAYLLATFLASCGGTTEPTPTDAASGADVVQPAFPADYESVWQEARSCRQSHEHDLHFVRVFASPEAEGPYKTLDTPYPTGSTLLKVEYDDDTCETAVAYTVMHREPAGYSPATFDWRWQQLDAERKVTLDEQFPPKCIACHATHCMPPKGSGFELTCVDDAAPPTEEPIPE